MSKSTLTNKNRRWLTTFIPTFTLTLVGVQAAPVAFPGSSISSIPSSSSATASSSTSPTSTIPSSTTSVSSSSSHPQVFITWAASTSTSISPGPTQIAPLLLEPESETDTVTITPSPTTWQPAPTFSNMAPFSVSAFAAGASNIAVLAGSPAPLTNTSLEEETLMGLAYPWDVTSNSLQVLYPNGSTDPANTPQGGVDFYATPLPVASATNVSLQYSVYFPPDFDFVKGGKLPGLYGGHKGCSGGNAAVDCFSTRMMWRTDGMGELYLYAPKDKQTSSLCSTPPRSICEADYGLSIGRGAWSFARGDWTTIRQDIWLNTPGENDGGFNIYINGRLVLHAADVRYRENADSCLQPMSADEDVHGLSSASNSSTSGIGTSSLWEDPSWSNEEGLASPMVSSVSLSSSGSVSTSSMSMSSSMSLTTPSARVTSPAAQGLFRLLRRQDDGGDDDDAPPDDDPPPPPPEEDDPMPLIITLTETVTQPVTTAITETITAATTAITAIITQPTTTIINPTVTQTVTNTQIMDVTNIVTIPTTISVPTTVLDTIILTEPTTIVGPTNTVIKTVVKTARVTKVLIPAPTPVIIKAPHYKVVTPQQPTTCSIGFLGLFFSTFFGGHTPDWAPQVDQYTYFRDFKMWVNH